MVPNKSQFCSQVPNFISKDVEKSRFRSRSRDFCQIFEGFGFGFEKFGLGKKVSVSEKFGLGKKSLFRKICSSSDIDKEDKLVPPSGIWSGFYMQGEELQNHHNDNHHFLLPARW